MKDVAPSGGAIFGIVFAGIIGIIGLGGLGIYLKDKMGSEEDLEALQEE